MKTRQITLSLLACVWLATTPGLVAAAESAPSVVVQRRAVGTDFRAEGVVEAVRQATLTAQVAGRVLELRADAGQRVRGGELLVRLDAREASGADQAARAQVSQAAASYERTKSLRARGFVSQAALDQAEAALKTAQGAAGSAAAGASHAAIAAPMAGVVGQRLVELGELALPGRPLLTVFDPKAMRVVVSIPQSQLAAVRGGASAGVEIPGSGAPLQSLRIEILPTVDAASHTATVRVYLPENAAAVMPGMAARVRFATGQGEKLTVPPAAVLRRGEITAVYVLAADGSPRLRQVRLGEAVADGGIEVLAGLADGERVSLDPVRAGSMPRSGK